MTLRLTGPPRRRAGPRIDRSLLARRARRVLRALGHARSELSLSLVDDDTMATLNASHRGRSGPTDVLSFSLLEGRHAEFRGALLGDVVVGVDTAWRQARRARRTLDDELARLAIHGVLHLLGHDHEEPEEARAMRAEERRLWRAVRE
ncbi:MAG: rRNA maturation RNase YbeY [Myxococcota bacterium]|nr:rRNA maturation RNase YbeY [Myxococcota bacterium]